MIDGIDGKMIRDFSSADLFDLGIPQSRVHEVDKLLTQIAKIIVSWSDQQEEEQAQAQPMAGPGQPQAEQVDDLTQDVIVGDEDDTSDEEKKGETPSEAEDLAWMRAVRTVRRTAGSCSGARLAYFVLTASALHMHSLRVYTYT